MTTLLNQSNVTGVAYDKAVHIAIDNNDTEPTITYIEVVKVDANDGTISSRPTGRPPIKRPIDLTETFTFVAGPNIGKTFTMEDLQIMVMSCYFKHHREDIAKIAAAQAEQQALAAKFVATFASAPTTAPTTN